MYDKLDWTKEYNISLVIIVIDSSPISFQEEVIIASLQKPAHTTICLRRILKTIGLRIDTICSPQ
jgi:hypothetical protein